MGRAFRVPFIAIFTTSSILIGSSAVRAFASNVAPADPVTVISFSSDAASPIPSGTTVTLTALATGGTAPLQYEFWRRAVATGEWTRVREYSPVNTFIWTPDDAMAAAYSFQVWVRSADSAGTYDAWGGLGPLEVTTAVPLIQAFTCVPGPVTVPAIVSCTVTGTAGDAEYEFWRYKGAAGEWSLVEGYSARTELSYLATEPGTDFVQVWARKRGSTATYQDWRGSSAITLVRAGLSLAPLTSTVSLFTTVGKPTTWTATPVGGTAPFQFKFWLYSEATGTWSVLQEYGPENVLNWTPTQVGRCAIQAWARQSDSSAMYDAWTGSGFFEVTTETLELRSVTANVTLPVTVRTPVTWTAQASGGTGPVEYKFWVHEAGVGWSILQDYSAATVATWVPERPGTYAVQAWARNAGSGALYDTWIGTPLFGIIPGTLEVTSFARSGSELHRTGQTETWIAAVAGGTGAPLEYQFWVYQEGVGWTLGQAYSPADTFTWTPPGAGTYALQAWVRSQGEPIQWAAWKGSPLFQVLPFPDVTGSWTLFMSGAYGSGTTSLGLSQSGSTLTGWMLGGPVTGSVSANGVVYFTGPAPAWDVGGAASFALMLDETGNTMSGRCTVPTTCTYAIASRIQ